MNGHRIFMYKCEPPAKPEDTLRNEPHIAAEVRCADGGVVRMRYSKSSGSAESWEVYSEINLYIPLAEESNAAKLSEFIKKKSFDDFVVDHDLGDCDPCDIPAVVDDDNHMFSALPGDPLAVSKFRILSHSHSRDNEKYTIATSLEVITSYIPYSRHRYTSIVQWFLDCAQLLISRIVRELIAQTGISCTNMAISKYDIIDPSECRYMRYAECSSDNVQWITATLGVRELPEFSVDDLVVTFTLVGSGDELEKIYSKMQDELVSSFWEQPACFTKANVAASSIIHSLNHGSLRHPNSPPPSIVEWCPRSYTLALDKSDDLVECIRQQLACTAAGGYNNDIYEHMNYLVIQIVAQLKQFLVSLFRNMFSRNICNGIHINPDACIPSGKLQSKRSIKATVSSRRKFFVFLYAFEPEIGYSGIQWGSWGSMYLTMAPGDGDGNKLHDFLTFIHGNAQHRKYVTLVDARDGPNECMPGSQQFVQRMEVKYKGREVDNYTNELELNCKVNTCFTPYDEEEYTTVDKWFKECAVVLLNRVLAEVSTRACIPVGKLLLSKDDPDIKLDKYSYIRHVRYMKDETPDVVVEISYWEQPEFYIDSVKIAVVPGGNILHSKLRMMETAGGVVMVDNFPICLYEAKEDYNSERPDLPIMADAAEWSDAIWDITGWIGTYSFIYYKPKMFLMSTSRSASFIQHVRELALPVVARCSQEELPSAVGNIAMCISKQVESLIKED